MNLDRVRLRRLSDEDLGEEWCRRGLRVAIAEKALKLARPRQRTRWALEYLRAEKRLRRAQEESGRREPRPCVACPSTLLAGAALLRVYCDDCRKQKDNEMSAASHRKRRARERAQ